MTKTQANEPSFVHGPYGFLIKPIGLAEDEWSLSHEHCENEFVVSVPLYALEEQALGKTVPSAPIVPAPAYGVKEALEPFAKAARAFEMAIGPDGIDDGLTVEAKISARPEHEAILSTADFSRARTAYDALSSAPVEEADAKAGEPLAFLVHNPIVTNIVRERESLFPASRENDAREFAKLLRADCTPLYATPPASTIPSEPEAKGEAGAGPVVCSSCDGTGDLIRVDGEWIGWCPCGAAANAGAGPVGETYYHKGKDADHFERLNNKDFAWALTCAAQDLNDSAENVSEWMPVTAFLDGAAERIKALEAAPLSDIEGRHWREKVDALNAECETTLLRAETAEAALAETRERLEKTEAALAELVDYYDTGHDQNAFLEAARAALSTQESSAALAGDGKEVGK